MIIKLYVCLGEWVELAYFYIYVIRRTKVDLKEKAAMLPRLV